MGANAIEMKRYVDVDDVCERLVIIIDDV